MKMIKKNIKEIIKALETTRNGLLVAKQFGLSPKQIYYFAKSRNINLQKAGRPQKYKYNKENLLKAIRRALCKKGGLLKLSQRRGIPYYVITNISKMIAK
jgi:hypothetical protein